MNARGQGTITRCWSRAGDWLVCLFGRLKTRVSRPVSVSLKRSLQRPLLCELLEPRVVLSAGPVLDPLGDQTVAEGKLVTFLTDFQQVRGADGLVATIDWGDGSVEDTLAVLDPVSIPDPVSLSITFDYRFDTNDFFDSQWKKDLLEQAGDLLVSRITDDLLPISPAGNNRWSASFPHPATGQIHVVNDLQLAGNEIIIFAGGRELDGNTLGKGGPGGYQVSGTQQFVNTVTARGQIGALIATFESDFGPWGGSISFTTDPSGSWHFSDKTEGLVAGKSDFLSVAVHELAHVLGFGTAKSWSRHVDDVTAEFKGLVSNAQYQGSGSLLLDRGDDGEELPFGHWQEGTRDGGRETAMDPTLRFGQRKLFTDLDFSGLEDLGWQIRSDTTYGGTIEGSHAYQEHGDFVVTVSLTDISGLTAAEMFQMTVTDNSRPLPWQNPIEPVDVNGDNKVTPIDVLLLINEINAPSTSSLLGALPVPPMAPQVPAPFLDVSGDNVLSPVDVLLVINHINQYGSGGLSQENVPMGAAFLGAVTGANQASVPWISTVVRPWTKPATVSPRSIDVANQPSQIVSENDREMELSQIDCEDVVLQRRSHRSDYGKMPGPGVAHKLGDTLQSQKQEMETVNPCFDIVFQVAEGVTEHWTRRYPRG